MTPRQHKATAYLALGANLGRRRGALRGAITAITSDDAVDLDADHPLAALYETTPVGGPTGQASYLNTAVRVHTTLTPWELLDAALSVEAKMGRIRHEKGGPRVIDIDLLLYDDRIINDTALTLPHPRMHDRLFVLAPLADIAPDVLHPVLDLTVATLADRARHNLPPGEQVTKIAGPDWFADVLRPPIAP